MNYSSFEQKYMVNRIPAAVPGASGKARFQMEKSAARQIQDPPEVKDILESIGYVADQYLDVGAATVKGVTQGTVGLPGDLEGLVRTVANSLGADVNEETLAPTTEEVKKWFDQNIGKVGDGENPYETIGEFGALGKPTELAVQGAVKGVKKTKDVIQNLDAPLPRPTGAIQPGDAMPEQRRVGTTGQYVGAPKGLDSPQKLGSLRRKLEGLTKEGEAARFWYERSGQSILDAVGGDKDEAEKLIQAIAITSQRTPVKTNFDFALQSYLQNKAGEPIKTGMFPKSMTKRLEDMYAGVDWEGRKTNNFYVNLMRAIDPEKVQGVTTDLWMMRSFGYSKDTPTPAQYNFVEREVNKIADKLGWEKQQVQAAIWTAEKAKREGTDIATAKFDFSDALKNNKMQISWESIPSKTSMHIPEIFDAPYQVQQEYHVAVSKAFLDDDGYDLLAKELGVPSTGEFEAPGFFEGKTSPGTQIETLIPKKYKGEPWGELDESGLKLMRVYAAARGLASKQDSLGIHRPFWNSTKKDANGMEIRIGRSFTEEETTNIAALLEKYAGHGEYSPIASRGGVRIINFDYINIPNKQFHNIVQSAVNDIKLNSEVNIKRFHAQNALIKNDWSKNKNGEDYLRHIRREGRSDLYRKVYGIVQKIHTRLDDIDTDFSERYGFTRNLEINKQFRSAENSGLDTPSSPNPQSAIEDNL